MELHLLFQDIRGMKKTQNGSGLKIADASYTVDTLATQGVLVTPKLTNTQYKHSSTTSERKSKTMVTQQNLTPQSFQTLISWLEGSLAKHFHLPVSELDLRTPEVRSYLMSLGFSETKDPDILYLKTSKVYLVTTAAKLSRQYLKFSPTQGTTFHGVYIIPRTMVSHKTENVSTLSEILEENVDPKYFLSEQAIKKLLSQTLNTSGDVGTFDGVRIRRLTPTECERLQGFPDGWTLGSDSQRYKQCGNAITVNVVQHVVRSLYETNND